MGRKLKLGEGKVILEQRLKSRKGEKVVEPKRRENGRKRKRPRATDLMV